MRRPDRPTAAAAGQARTFRSRGAVTVGQAHSVVTVARQTAPHRAAGILVYGADGRHTDNAAIDHCSVVWAADENGEAYAEVSTDG